MSTHRRAPEGEKDSDPRAEPAEHLSQAPPSGFRQGEKGKVSGSGWTVTDQALGVAPSTVGVLLFRAAAKLGVKSRRDLLLAYEQLVLRSQSNIP